MIRENFLEIEKYLKSKNLSSVVFNEIYDHFVLQILELMKKDVNFQEAFLKTKIQWQFELEMVKADLFSFKKLARIEKTVLQSRFRNIILSSTLFSLVGLIAVLFFNDYFYLLQIGLSIILFFLLFYNFVFQKMKFREYHDLSFHPLILRNLILGCVLLLGVGYFTQSIDFWDMGINKIFLVYAITVQIQLLYFRSKKINVLMS